MCEPMISKRILFVWLDLMFENSWPLFSNLMVWFICGKFWLLSQSHVANICNCSFPVALSHI